MQLVHGNSPASAVTVAGQLARQQQAHQQDQLGGLAVLAVLGQVATGDGQAQLQHLQGHLLLASQAQQVVYELAGEAEQGHLVLAGLDVGVDGHALVQGAGPRVGVPDLVHITIYAGVGLTAF